MKNVKKKIELFNWKALITACYITAVWTSFVVLNTTSFQHKAVILLLIIIAFLVSYLFSFFVFRKLEKINAPKRVPMERKKKIMIFAGAGAVMLFVMLLWYIAFYPGSFSPDSIDQYSQAYSGEYSDWHPVWHTLIFFTVPLKLTGQGASIVLFQILCFSLTMGYLTLTIRELGGIQAALVSFLYIVLNPYVGYITMYPWKDVGFAIGGVICLVWSVRIMLLKEKTPIWKLILMGIAFASATLFRHNAILFTGPLLLALLFNLEKKTWVKLTVSMVAALLIIRVPVYSMLKVESPGKRVVETMGLPLTVIGNVVKQSPQVMDDELSDFAYSLATQEQWEELYSQGSFNSIKFKGIDTGAVEEKGYFGMLRLMLKCFKLSPQASFEALFALTDVVYGFETGLEGNVGAGITNNSYGIAYPAKRSEGLCTFLGTYAKTVNNSFLRYLRTYGIVLLMVLICALSNLQFRSRESWKRTLVVLPLFTYDFGTMLLLSGDDSRFFYITFLAAPLLICYTFFCKGELKNAE